MSQCSRASGLNE